MEQKADYIVNTGTNYFENMEPVDTARSEAEGIAIARKLAGNGVIAEVVYAPEDDDDINEVRFSTDGKTEKFGIWEIYKKSRKTRKNI